MSRALEKRVAAVEAATAKSSKATVANLIVASRSGRSRRPQRSRDTLIRLGQESGLVGRLARGDLRIGRIGTSIAPITDPEHELAMAMGEFFADPLGFVMFSYEWGTTPALQVVKLPEPWASQYDSAYGPDAWACTFLDDMAGEVKARNFDGVHAVDAIRMAVSSGHGIGKGVLTSWLADWLMSTRPNARGIVTASTGPQLETKTWAQLAAWTKRCITADWFEVSIGRGSMKMVQVDSPEGWRVDAQTARADNSESFAGLHSADSAPFYLIDESSGVPDAIHEVMQGGLTDGEPFMVALGNPTKNTGWFHQAFHAMRHRWNTRSIDSRTVQVTNKTLIAQWLDDFGEDSDFVKARVRGIFPSASSLQFIGRDLVDGAMQRETVFQQGEAVVVGVDVARFGDDQSVIRTRLGRNARDFKPIRLRGADTMQVAARVAEHANHLCSVLGVMPHIFVDGGGVGGGVVDRLRQLNFDVIEVQFGGKANDQRKYANKRCEMWGLMKEWLQIGIIENDEQLADDLTGVEYSFNVKDQIQLERKESMRARGFASPDDADALALTFAQPVSMRMDDDMPRASGPKKEYDPMALDGHDPYAALV